MSVKKSMQLCEITRLFVAETMKADKYEVTYDGGRIAIVNYDIARRLILGHMMLEEIERENTLPG